MAVKVLISRQFKQDRINEAHDLLKKMRSVVTLRPGYISGQTLVAAKNPNKLVVVSTWSGQKTWEEWVNDEKRKEFSKRIGEMLISPEQVDVFFVGQESPE